MVYGLLATVTSAARIQPVDPFGRIGSSTCNQSPWSCSTRKTRGAPFSLGLSSVAVGSPSTGSAKTSTCAPVADATIEPVAAGAAAVGRRLGDVAIGAVTSGRLAVVADPPPPQPASASAPATTSAVTILPAAIGAT